MKKYGMPYLNVIPLFRETSKFRANKLGYRYPDYDDKVIRYIRKLYQSKAEDLVHSPTMPQAFSLLLWINTCPCFAYS